MLFLILIVWSDHANQISLAYAGSGALKTEFTRTGKMSVMVQIEDGQKSVARYLKNNFFDGARQASHDLLTTAEPVAELDAYS